VGRVQAQPQRPAALPPSLPKQESAPSFSPFERDTRRKEPVQSTESRPAAMSTSTRTEGSLALAPEPVTETFVEPAPEVAAVESWSADQARTVAANAVHAAGQHSASQLLHDSAWSNNVREWKIEVAVNEKMLGISVNPEARKIAEKALRDSGITPSRINLIATGASKPAAKAEFIERPAGDLQQLANENELVQKAKELFQADIRDVVDLRGRRR
jgi:DNA polymerase-3 subunit gamma/tau